MVNNNINLSQDKNIGNNIGGIPDEYNIQTRRMRLLDTVEEGAELFNDTIREINSKRNKKQQIPISSPGLCREQAEDWLTDERIIATTALPETSQRQCMIFPQLRQPISVTEVIDSWSSASEYGSYSRSEFVKFLGKTASYKLSNYSPEQTDDYRFAVIPTVYDTSREGSVAQQKDNFTTLQQDFPEIDTATLFDGSLLARKYKKQHQIRTWKDSYVRDINSTPIEIGATSYVPSAYVDVLGYVCLSASNMYVERATRLRVV